MSDWLFDLGNSRFKAAPWSGGAPGQVQAWPHGEDIHQAPVPRGRRAFVASVASQALTAAVLERLHANFDEVHVARSQAGCAGVEVAYRQPRRLGVDRFLALLAAHKGGGEVLLAGVGTALTSDLLDASGRHHGGRIAPSPTLMREILHARAAQLPAQGGQYREFADDTDDALASGCDGAAVALVLRSLEQGRQLLGRDPALLLHGGGAEALAPLLPQARLRPSLVLEGLAIWAGEADASR